MDVRHHTADKDPVDCGVRLGRIIVDVCHSNADEDLVHYGVWFDHNGVDFCYHAADKDLVNCGGRLQIQPECACRESMSTQARSM